MHGEIGHPATRRLRLVLLLIMSIAAILVPISILMTIPLSIGIVRRQELRAAYEDPDYTMGLLLDAAFFRALFFALTLLAGCAFAVGLSVEEGWVSGTITGLIIVLVALLNYAIMRRMTLEYVNAAIRGMYDRGAYPLNRERREALLRHLHANRNAHQRLCRRHGIDLDHIVAAIESHERIEAAS